MTDSNKKTAIFECTRCPTPKAERWKSDACVQCFFVHWLSTVANYLPGATTLNQMRIVQFVAFMDGDINRPVCATEISRTLGIPLTTVSRTVASLVERKELKEKRSETDDRVSYVLLREGNPIREPLNADIMDLMHEHFGTSELSAPRRRQGGVPEGKTPGE